MKLRVFFLSAILTLTSLTARTQIVQMFYNGFEQGETLNWTADGSYVYDETIYSSGARSMKLLQSNSSDVTLYLDTLDFTQNTLLQYIALEFDHICNVPVNITGGVTDPQIGLIYVKLAHQTEWTQLTSQHYNRVNGGSSDFSMLGSFNMNSYSNDWRSTIDNDAWKSERFDLNSLLSNVSASQRKVLIKFVLKKKTSGNTNGVGWWFDNIRVRASQNAMVRPSISMVLYPDGGSHPSSRGARIELDATTTVQQGICADSVYLMYKVGSSSEVHRLDMDPVTGVANRYSCRIPFEGFDTMMYFYCVAKDNTTNHNDVTYPLATGAWLSYKCVRGSEQLGVETSGFVGTSQNAYFPFNPFADHKCEFVYDSALMAEAGYGPGAITDLRFTVASVNTEQVRPNFQIRMKNIGTSDYVMNDNSALTFTNSYMHVVYDSTLVVEEAGPGVQQTIHLQDSFFYAGKDLLMQIIYNGTVDMGSTSIKMIPTATNKKSIFFAEGLAEYNYNAYTDNDFRTASDITNLRPAFVMTEKNNQPLLRDMGVSAMVYPRYDSAMTNQPGEHLIVTLNNFGALTVDSIVVSYMIDDSIQGQYHWSGPMVGLTSSEVTIATDIHLPVGYHTLKVWVEDSLWMGGVLYRDHEPYNDTASTEFIVCDGPMSGVRYVGGTQADYTSIEEFLFAVSSCGVEDSLIVKLAPGVYPPFAMTAIDGLSATHYLVFEPESDSVYIRQSASSNTSIVDLSEVSNIRFRNITFERTAYALSYMVNMGSGSDNCRFESCVFVDSLTTSAALMRIQAMIQSGFADNLIVDSCRFVGGNIGVNLTGQAVDMRASGNIVRNNHFENQYVNAVNATNQNSPIIRGNEMYDVMSNSSYVTLLYQCYGALDMQSNKIYTTHGAGAVGASNIVGTEASHAVIANNMVVCEDDGEANLMTTPFNIIKATWTDVVYNSIKMTAPERSNVPAAAFGGEEILNSRFMNNIVTCYDDANIAFSYVPLTSTSNTVGHNIYYSEGVALTRLNSSVYTSLANWLVAMPSDTNSVEFDPRFLNGSLVDLRTYNRLVKGVGTPLSNVTTDIFGLARDATAPCAGAFEFVSLDYDFEPEAITNPAPDNCRMPEQSELVIRVRNVGVEELVPGGSVSLSFEYQVNGGTVQTVSYNGSFPAEDTMTIYTGSMVSMPCNGKRDSTYTIKLWSVCADDPNQTNDTLQAEIISRYHPAAPTSFIDSILYADRDTITPTAGVDTWQVYDTSSAPERLSQIFWYYDSTDAEPFYVGGTYVTDTLMLPQTYYIRQNRSMPIVRITQVQVRRANNSIGLSDPMPVGLPGSSNTNTYVVQLTNVGDDTAYLAGDTLQTITAPTNASAALTVQNVVLGDVTIAPGDYVLLYSGTNDPTMENYHLEKMGAFTSPAYNAKYVLTYRRGGVIEDAVAFNGIVEDGRWSSIGVPEYVWRESGVTISANTVGGFYRQSFKGRAADWVQATNSDRMFLSAIDESWIRYTDNGCAGEFGTVTVRLGDQPTTDIALKNFVLPEGCGLSNEEITLDVYNYGTEPVPTATIHYLAGGDTVTETITSSIPASGYITYTFTTPLDMTVSYDSTITVKVWTDAVTGDDPRQRRNDTISASAAVLYTPEAPVHASPIEMTYATSDTIIHAPLANTVTLWYDKNDNLLCRDSMYVTPIMYVDDTIKIGYQAFSSDDFGIGDGDALNSKTSYPMPYQLKNKYAKQQYLYSANELTASGMLPGPITAISFWLDSIYDDATFSFDTYTISLGLTEDTIFSGNNQWKTAEQVYSRENYTVTPAENKTWITHVLDSTFEWDGVSSLVVQIAHTATTAISTGAQTHYTSKANTAIYKAQNSALSPSVTEYSGSGSRSGNRPNIMITGTNYGCEGPTTSVAIHLTGVPENDGSIGWAVEESEMVYNSCDSIEVKVSVRNLGSVAIQNYNLHYHVGAVTDTTTFSTTAVTSNVATGEYDTATLFRLPFLPGRYPLTAVVSVVGDTITTNDTINGMFTVRFCGDTYTIADSGADYSSFTEAIDTLHVVGIEGPVVFKVAPGEYNEQLLIHQIEGSSATNTITFQGTGDSTILKATTTQTENYVIYLDSTANLALDSISIISRPLTTNNNTKKYGTVLYASNVNNLILSSSTLRVAGYCSDKNGVPVNLADGGSDITITNCVIDSGYYSIRTSGTETITNIAVTNNRITSFMGTGIGVSLRNIVDVDVSGNYIYTSVSKGTGIHLGVVTGSVSVMKNQIYLYDQANSSCKVGIKLANVQGTNQHWGMVVNNMISCYHGGNSVAATPYGIMIDTASAYLNVYYNSVLMTIPGLATANPTKNSSAIYVGNSSNPNHLRLMNNIFANYGFGQAMHVMTASSVVTCNYNAYYVREGAAAMATWGNGVTCTNLSALQNANNDDGSSLQEEPYFVNDTNLHLLMTNFVAKAQYNADVLDDIDGTLRKQIPAPTIGAHEMSRPDHDLTVVRISEPRMPASLTVTPYNIESDSVKVIATFYNNGTATETGVSWYAFLTHPGDTTLTEVFTSEQRSLGTMTAGQLIVDSVMLPTELGVIDTQMVYVKILYTSIDNDSTNDMMSTPVYLAPAYNVRAVSMSSTEGCHQEAAVIRISLQNVGNKDIPVGDTIKIGYHTELYHGSGVTYNNNLTIANLPDTVEEEIVVTNLWAKNAARTFTFNTTANLYPVDTFVNIRVNIKGWSTHPHDITKSNDTTANKTVNSYYTPAPPVGINDTVDYASYGRVTASQVNNRPIRWYRDSTASPFYNSTNYNQSCTWANTPQYFHDSTYYLQCTSDKGCLSYFSEVSVIVLPPLDCDMGVSEVLAPLGSRVYMENDTVRVRIINYGAQAQSNIPVVYQNRRGNTILQTVTEVYNGTIEPGESVIYTFDSLVMITTPTSNQAYKLRFWTDMAEDELHRNDTLHMQYHGGNVNPGIDYTINSMAETYCAPSVGGPGGSNIGRVAFNAIDFDIPALGRTYTNLGAYPNPEQPALPIYRGMSDSLIVQTVNLGTERARCKIAAYIDFDRSGTFTNDERVLYNENAEVGAQVHEMVNIPQSASYGYMKMRIVMVPASNIDGPLACVSAAEGHVVDFLLFVEPNPPQNDVAIDYLVSPRDYLILDTSSKVATFHLSNRGTSLLTEAIVYYSYIHEADSTPTTDSVVWTGRLMGGTSVNISIPPHSFDFGTTVLRIWHNMTPDENPYNNSIEYEYHRFHTVTLVMWDDFDSTNHWYAPRGYNNYSRNYWECGVPEKANIASAFSVPNAWVTDRTAVINTGTRGNVSYLYSPIIDISQIRPDTLSFRLVRNLTNGSNMYVEFYNFESQWVKLEYDSMTSFYNNTENNVFDGTSTANAYSRYWIRTARVSGDFPELLQFRFVYTTPQGSSASASFGGGCAVDDFRIGRAQRAVDAGVVAITQPANPRYGETYCPQVLVKNYGYDTLRAFQIGYTHYGTNLAKVTQINGASLAPGAIDTFDFDSPFIVTSDFPDVFEISAFTIMPTDLYWDNDSTTQKFRLSPLDHDISAEEFVRPLDNVIAGDSVPVTMRIRNFGVAPIETATATYVFNRHYTVTEQIDFNAMLGRPLGSMEYFNYTFNEKFRSMMGVMTLEAYIKCDSNDYIYNDTIEKRVNGISAITDLAAAAVVVDTSSHTEVRVQIIIDNRGARGANNFEVGFWIDNDTTTKFSQTYYRDLPIPALTTGYHLFDTVLPTRTAPYDHVTAYVHVADDNDPTNDTTTTLATQFIDLEAVKVIVEENANPDCRVFIQVANRGNLTLSGKTIQLKGAVNGQSLTLNTVRTIEPGSVVTFEFNRTVTKDSERNYVGSGRLILASDINTSNNETSVVEVINYMEGVPVVEASGLVLEQNYPNPFSGLTTVPFSLPNSAEVQFFVMDATGHIVYRTKQFCHSGANTLTLDMSQFSTGVYYYGIVVDGERQMRKMILK